jgi:hypothetical protein
MCSWGVAAKTVKKITLVSSKAEDRAQTNEG